MAKKNQLPASLELLLDTMCNTFGAIMFIAISLVIISQVTTKLVRDKEPIKITEEYLEQLRGRVKALEDELVQEEKKMAEKALAAIGMPKDKKEKVEELLALRAENQRLVLDLSRQKDELKNAKLESLQMEADLEAAKSDIQLIVLETSQKESLFERMLLERDQRKNRLQNQLEQAEKDSRTLADKANATRGQTLTFSMEVSTTGEKDYTVCLKNERMYSEGLGEIIQVRDSDTNGHFSFSGNGHAVKGVANDAFFAPLLKGLTRQNFVTIWCDRASYPILVELRKHLRKREIKVRFFWTEEFKFVYSGGANASY